MVQQRGSRQTACKPRALNAGRDEGMATGEAGTTSARLVLQRHEARTTHYDEGQARMVTLSYVVDGGDDRVPVDVRGHVAPGEA
jgi:hypothetical protein